MLIPSAVLDGIRSGAVSLAFRRWRRPTVRTGGTLLTSAGQLQIDEVAVVSEADLTDTDARRAGYDSLGALLKELNRRSAGEIHRIEFGELLPDPRIELRETVPDPAEAESIALRLARLDRSVGKPWTRRILRALADHPGLRSTELAQALRLDADELKRNVRKLKNLGLTISLGTGYRLSPRGEAILAFMPDEGSDTGA